MRVDAMNACRTAGGRLRWLRPPVRLMQHLIRWSPRTLWRLSVLGLAATTMAGCVSADVESGVFMISTADGAVEYIGESAGIPVWSPTGDALAWGNEDGVFVRVLDEPEARQLADGNVPGVPAWSPDGNRLAFVDSDAASLVVVSATSGSEQFTQPIDVSRSDGSRFPLITLGGPTWAPDGSRLAFVCWDGAGDEVCVVDADGRGLRQVTRLKLRGSAAGTPTRQSTMADSNAGPPAWSPLGNIVAVPIYPERPGAPTGVFLVNVDVGVARRVSSLQPNSAVSWFPNGGSLLFSAFRQERSDAIRVRLRTSTLHSLTAGLPQASRNPALSGDGSQIAVESGTGVVVLGAGRPAREFTVPGLRSTNPAWSPGGEAIAVAAITDPIVIYN